MFSDTMYFVLLSKYEKWVERVEATLSDSFWNWSDDGDSRSFGRYLEWLVKWVGDWLINKNWEQCDVEREGFLGRTNMGGSE